MPDDENLSAAEAGLINQIAERLTVACLVAHFAARESDPGKFANDLLARGFDALTRLPRPDGLPTDRWPVVLPLIHKQFRGILAAAMPDLSRRPN